MVSAELQNEIEQFLYSEVRLLSEGRYREWLGLLTDDIKYWMPVRETKAVGQSGVGGGEELAIFDDDKAFLAARVERFYSDLAHAERPPSRTRYFVSNVVVRAQPGGDVDVECNLLVYQARLEKTECFFVGRREDELRKADAGWRISKRKIVLDQILLPRSISLFF
jgi:3-phenylpropionate/cinnamic acid dioxygenase small subunit